MTAKTAPKQPQDRKPKQADLPETMTATVRGTEWTVSVDALDDFELVDAFLQLQEGEDVTRLPFILRRLLGDQWKQAMDTLRSEDTGRVSIEDGAKFAGELMEALSPNS